MSQSRRRRGHKVKHPAYKSSQPRPKHKDWRKSADRTLEVVICVGHIMGVVMIVVDHLL